MFKKEISSPASLQYGMILSGCTLDTKYDALLVQGSELIDGFLTKTTFSVYDRSPFIIPLDKGLSQTSSTNGENLLGGLWNQFHFVFNLSEFLVECTYLNEPILWLQLVLDLLNYLLLNLKLPTIYELFRFRVLPVSVPSVGSNHVARSYRNHLQNRAVLTLFFSGEYPRVHLDIAQKQLYSYFVHLSYLIWAFIPFFQCEVLLSQIRLYLSRFNFSNILPNRKGPLISSPDKEDGFYASFYIQGVSDLWDYVGIDGKLVAFWTSFNLFFVENLTKGTKTLVVPKGSGRGCNAAEPEDVTRSSHLVRHGLYFFHMGSQTGSSKVSSWFQQTLLKGNLLVRRIFPIILAVLVILNGGCVDSNTNAYAMNAQETNTNAHDRGMHRQGQGQGRGRTISTAVLPARRVHSAPGRTGVVRGNAANTGGARWYEAATGGTTVYSARSTVFSERSVRSSVHSASRHSIHSTGHTSLHSSHMSLTHGGAERTRVRASASGANSRFITAEMLSPEAEAFDNIVTKMNSHKGYRSLMPIIRNLPEGYKNRYIRQMGLHHDDKNRWPTEGASRVSFEVNQLSGSVSEQSPANILRHIEIWIDSTPIHDIETLAESELHRILAKHKDEVETSSSSSSGTGVLTRTRLKGAPFSQVLEAFPLLPATIASSLPGPSNVQRQTLSQVAVDAGASLAANEPWDIGGALFGELRNQLGVFPLVPAPEAVPPPSRSRLMQVRLRQAQKACLALKEEEHRNLAWKRALGELTEILSAKRKWIADFQGQLVASPVNFSDDRRLAAIIHATQDYGHLVRPIVNNMSYNPMTSGEKNRGTAHVIYRWCLDYVTSLKEEKVMERRGVAVISDEYYDRILDELKRLPDHEFS
jgi:hypothetical protein